MAEEKRIHVERYIVEFPGKNSTSFVFLDMWNDSISFEMHRKPTTTSHTPLIQVTSAVACTSERCWDMTRCTMGR